jgi:hypothetical protein
MQLQLLAARKMAKPVSCSLTKIRIYEASATVLLNAAESESTL